MGLQGATAWVSSSVLALSGYVTLGKSHGCSEVHSYDWVTDVLNSLESVNIMKVIH